MNGFDFLGAGIAGIIGFLVGAAWDAPFTFGPLAIRFRPDLVDRLGTDLKLHWLRYSAGLIASLIQAYTLLALLLYFHHLNLATALGLGAWLWLGFTVAPSLIDAAFNQRPLRGWMVDMSHRLIVTLIIAMILGVWPSP